MEAVLYGPKEVNILNALLQENKNEFLQIVCAYGSLSVPARGSEVVFQPLEHLQAIQYKRCLVSDLGIDEISLDIELCDPIKSAEVCFFMDSVSLDNSLFQRLFVLVCDFQVNARLAVAEEAVALSVWTTATICRVLSLDSVCFCGFIFCGFFFFEGRGLLVTWLVMMLSSVAVSRASSIISLVFYTASRGLSAYK